MLIHIPISFVGLHVKSSDRLHGLELFLANGHICTLFTIFSYLHKARFAIAEPRYSKSKMVIDRQFTSHKAFSVVLLVWNWSGIIGISIQERSWFNMYMRDKLCLRIAFICRNYIRLNWNAIVCSFCQHERFHHWDHA